MCDNPACSLETEVIFFAYYMGLMLSTTLAQNSTNYSPHLWKNTAPQRVIGPGKITILHMPGLWSALNHCLYIHSSNLYGPPSLPGGNKIWIEMCRWRYNRVTKLGGIGGNLSSRDRACALQRPHSRRQCGPAHSHSLDARRSGLRGPRSVSQEVRDVES